MIVNIIIGFLLPWTVGAYFIKRNALFVLTVGIIAALISFLINDIGYFMSWWYVTPKRYGALSFVPYNFGIFVVFAVFMIYMIRKYNRVWLFILIFTVGKTALESILVLTGKVVYNNGWNLGFTFLSYFTACAIGYLLFTLLWRSS